jgi:radical SAM protein with 4Fe4S-binding SPASM domain
MRTDVAGELPKAVSLQVTDACNLRCRMCYEWGDTGIYSRPDGLRKAAVLDLELAKRIVDELESVRPFYSLFGGEPLMYPGLEELIRTIKQAGSFIDTPTNGTLLEKHAAMLVETGFDYVRVSLDGPRDIDDRQRGEGSYDKAMTGIAALQREKRKAGSDTPMIGIIYTVTPENHTSLERFFLHDLDLDAIGPVTIQMQNYVTPDMGEAYARLLRTKFDLSNERYWRSLLRSPADFAEMDTAELSRQANLVCERLQALGKPVQFLPPTLTEGSLDAYFAARWTEMADTYTHCSVPWLSADVTARGELASCHVFYDLVMGSLYEHSFEDLWNSERYRTFRAHMRSEGLMPICYGCCILYLAN